MLSDEELIDAYRQGQDEALNALLRRHLSRIRSSVFGMVLDSNDADDLAQEILVKAVRGLPQFNGRSKFSTWLHRIMINTTRTFLEQRVRSARRCAELPIDAISRNDSTLELEQGELDQQISAAMALLSQSLRTALVLVSMQGLPVEAVAESEGCSTATIYWRVHQARKQMRQRLAGYLQ